MIGFRIIRQGERVAVWNMRGQVRFEDGPQRLWLFREIIEPMQRYSAEAGEYLAILRQDGSAQHMRGPAQVWFDPVQYESIDVCPLVPLDANEAIVIYRRDADGKVARRILRGPAQYMPDPNEWLHQFSWHGSDPKQPRRKLPYALKFQKLRVIPDQTYFDVRDVRTADDALLTVQVMIFFELMNIDRMLDQTHDPIADFINAVTADVIDFAAGRPFEQFKSDTEKLNELEAYPNLTGRAERIGYRINKVVYRGYEANPRLQTMHDNAIEARTALQLEAETEEQAQGLADLKLVRQAKRAEQEQAMEQQRSEHEQRLKQQQHEHEQRIQQSKHEQNLRESGDLHRQEIEFQQETNTVEIEHVRAKNAEEAGRFRSMHEMKIDLTRYLVAQYQHPDRLIRIDSDGDRAQLHLHQ